MPSVEEIADSLRTNGAIEKWGTREEPGYWVTAYGLSHIAESSERLIERMTAIPTALDASTQNDLLIEIREDLVHLAYHIVATPYFASVMERVASDPDANPEAERP